jgi:hypothetical protein
MIYFLYILLALQILVVLWFVWKNAVTPKQRNLSSIVQEINAIKKETENIQIEILVRTGEITAEKEFLEEIHKSLSVQNSLIKYKLMILKKTNPSLFETYLESKKRPTIKN